MTGDAYHEPHGAKYQVLDVKPGARDKHGIGQLVSAVLVHFSFDFFLFLHNLEA